LKNSETAFRDGMKQSKDKPFKTKHQIPN